MHGKRAVEEALGEVHVRELSDSGGSSLDSAWTNASGAGTTPCGFSGTPKNEQDAQFLATNPHMWRPEFLQ
ncbi:hypothetical protein LBMAG49_05440 [Planctomycetota bacterium]|nr:hypothetical protein LBMAG49_05440 [Planctomycetota bacterium]